MNKQELIESISHLPSDCSGPRPMIDKLTALELIKLLDEPRKVTIPQFVADWIEEGKKHCKDVSDLFDFDFTNEKVGNWFLQERPFDLVARAWLDGYEIEKEKRYYVRFKFIEEAYSYLTLIKHLNTWTLTSIKIDKKFRTEHTKKQLEEAGFGWVFDCEGIEVEEITE